MQISLSEKKVFLLFIVVSVLLRLFSFFPSVLDHDESTYMIIGRDILNGKTLYTDVTDTKPPGIFLFYAGMEFLFRDSIFFKRLIFALIVGITAFLIYSVSTKMFGNNKVGIASGLIYIFYTSIWTYHGRSPNTELLFNLTTISALLLFLKPKTDHYFFGGLILGIGFIIKYLVLFDLAAFLIFFFVTDIIRNSKLPWDPLFWTRYFMAGIAFLIPFGLVNLWFWLSNNFQDFFFITYKLPANYGSDPSLLRYLIMLLDLTAKFLPISFLVFYVIFKRNKPLSTNHKYFFALWIICVFAAMYAPGKEFSHYTIQLMLPLSLLAGIFFHPGFKKDILSAKIFSGKTGIVMLLSSVLIIQSVTFVNEIIEPDYPREVSEIIKKDIKPGDQVYVSNYEHVIYYLLDIDSPTRFVHSVLLFNDSHKAFNINAVQEIKRIIGKNPAFVVIERKNELVEQLIKNKYTLLKKFRNNEIKLYKRN